jgi:hypothetical protein
MHESQVPPEPVVEPVDPVVEPVEPVVEPVEPVVEPVEPVVEPVEPVVEPPHWLAHSVEQFEQMQVPIAWNSLTAAEPAVVAHDCSQALSPEAQLPRQVRRALHLVSFEQVLICDSQAPPEPSTMFWQVSQVLPEVVPPVEPVPAVLPVVPPVEPVEPPPH